MTVGAMTRGTSPMDQAGWRSHKAASWTGETVDSRVCSCMVKKAGEPLLDGESPFSLREEETTVDAGVLGTLCILRDAWLDVADEDKLEYRVLSAARGEGEKEP